ncbi:hypothetical protein [Symmachiella macrocystis]|uniref:hypothetical protein n=1 Tax=Symmachiella macrocystis TaxID=2527985 RepID=UPI0011B37B7D|nr:hypothetical protein [Symmachiella macrocystis]
MLTECVQAGQNRGGKKQQRSCGSRDANEILRRAVTLRFTTAKYVPPLLDLRRKLAADVGDDFFTIPNRVFVEIDRERCRSRLEPNPSFTAFVPNQSQNINVLNRRCLSSPSSFRDAIRRKNQAIADIRENLKQTDRNTTAPKNS